MSASTLYFVQHGLALSKQEDPERPLSSAGKQQTQAIANQLKAACIPLSAVYHSGKLRARQTAQIFADSFALNEEAITGLAPNDPVTELVPRLNQEHALYVGHLPQLQKLAGYLLSGKDDNEILQFKNSAVICLVKSTSKKAGQQPEKPAAGRYQLAWYLPPAL